MTNPAEGDVPDAETSDVADVSESAADAALDLSDDSELIEDVADVVEAGGRPPLPGAPPPRKRTGGAEILQELSADDNDFLVRVFSQVHDVDWRTPPPPPPKNLTGLDKKMQGLRDRVRKLERDLARLAFVWGVKQKEVHEVEKIIGAAEARRSQAEARYTQLQEQAQRSAETHQQHIHKLTAAGNQLETEKKTLQGQLAATAQKLQETQQQLNGFVEEAKQKLGAAQQAFNQLREQSAQRITSLEAQVRQRDDQMTTLQAELDAANVSAGKLEATLEDSRGETERLRADYEARLRALEAELHGTQDKLATSERSVAERDGKLAAREEEMGRVRKDHEDQVAELGGRLDEMRKSLRQKDSELEDAREQARLARADAESLGKKVAELEKPADKPAQ